MPIRTSARPSVPAAAGSTAPSRPASPRAARLPRPRWLDLRLVVGVGLVLASVLLGARLVGSADDTVALWAARSALAPGQELAAGAVEARQVRLDEGQDAYVSAAAPLPAGWLVTRPVAAGELLPRAAVQAPGSLDVRYVTVAVPRDELPAGLGAGSRVEVWAAPPGDGRTGDAAAARSSGESPSSGSAADPTARRLLGPTTVSSVVSETSTFGAATGTVPVVLAVARQPAGASPDQLVAEVLASSRSGQLYLVGLPSGAR